MNSVAGLLDALQPSSSETMEGLVRLYGPRNLDYQKRRYRLLLEKFRDRFPEQSDVVVLRAPGRVNLIGEHTDYNGFPVLPMAIDRDILVAAGSRMDQQVQLSNVEGRYPDRLYEIGSQIPPFPVGDWGNYPKAAAQAVFQYALSMAPPCAHRLRGLNLVVSGDLPSSGGLSSSSALVVVNALALVHVNGLSVNHTTLADLLAKGERYVGTEGGGMDQAISLLGESGTALKIDFFPLRVRPVPIPAGYRVMVINSMIKAEKTHAVMEDYNRRPRECRMIVALINQSLSEQGVSNSSIQRLADLRKLGAAGSQIEGLVEQVLECQGMKLEQISERLRVSVDHVKSAFLTLKDGCVLSQPARGFPLTQRYRHVISEAERVEKAVAALEEGQAIEMGRLMYQSHQSCADDFEISCPELDALVGIARKSGSTGARLTGAGFGGYVVALVEESNVDEFVQSIEREYFQSYLKYRHPDILVESEALPNHILTCVPTQGAGKVFGG